jgi:hypothetical protein
VSKEKLSGFCANADACIDSAAGAFKVVMFPYAAVIGICPGDVVAPTLVSQLENAVPWTVAVSIVAAAEDTGLAVGFHETRLAYVGSLASQASEACVMSARPPAAR